MAPSTAAERAYAVLKESILDGSTPGGELLSEAEVGAPLGISRTPVHEAFLRLKEEGLLRLVPRRGAVVVPVGPGEAADVLEVRRALETAAVRRLAAPAASADATRAGLGRAFKALLDTQRQLAGEGDVVAFARADAEFHRAIVAASGNVIALQFYDTLTDRQRRMAVSSIGSRTEHLITLTEEHRTLAHLVEAGDADRFDSALGAHLAGTHSTLLGGAP